MQPTCVRDLPRNNLVRDYHFGCIAEEALSVFVEGMLEASQ